MPDQNNALIVGIAQIIDYPSVYMGGPSRNSLRIAETIVKEFGADIARADRAAPEGQVQCCMCGRKDLSTIEGDGGEECQLWDGRWTCSRGCYDKACMIHEAALTPPPAAPMEICSKCMGTGTAGHPDSGYTCDCNGGMVAAPTDNTALVDVLASLAAAISLLERGGKKAAPSDKMFEQMLIDYRASLERGRTAALASREAPPAAPERQGYFGPMGIPHWSRALTPPPASQQEAVTVAEAAAVLLKARDALEDKIEKQDGGTYWMTPEESQLRLLDAIALRALKGENE